MLERYLQAKLPLHMTKALFLLFILLTLSLGQTKAQSINTDAYKLKIQKGRIEKKSSQIFWHIPTTFTNLSKDTLKYFNMTCSWQEAYLLNTEKLNIMINLCDKNVPAILSLAPNKSVTVELDLMVNDATDTSPISFKIGFNLIPANKPRLEFNPKEFLQKKNVIWSNEVKILN